MPPPADPAIAHGPAEEAERKAALMLRLRSSGVRALDVLRAMEAVPRDAFLPTRLRDWTSRDAALPIGCGQTTPEPSFVARLLEALALAPDARVLEVGSGSGYVTALLARLAREVTGVERYRGLAEGAQARLAAQGLDAARVIWGDGLAAPGASDETFDRILVQAAVPSCPEALLERLAPGGALLYPRLAEGSQAMVRMARGAGGAWEEMALFPARQQQAQSGRSAVL